MERWIRKSLLLFTLDQLVSLILFTELPVAISFKRKEKASIPPKQFEKTVAWHHEPRFPFTIWCSDLSNLFSQTTPVPTISQCVPSVSSSPTNSSSSSQILLRHRCGFSHTLLCSLFLTHLPFSVIGCSSRTEQVLPVKVVSVHLWIPLTAQGSTLPPPSCPHPIHPDLSHLGTEPSSSATLPCPLLLSNISGSSHLC